VKYGIYAPNYGELGDARLLAETAREAEQAGWDGFFMWDHMLWTHPANGPTVDPWIALAAVAMTTEHIRIGALVTPVARRRPWKLAREIVTLDHLSGGRVVLGVGSGHDAFREYSAFGEPPGGVKLHGEMLDEGLDVLSGLWSGRPFSYSGKHYQIKEAEFLPTPVQQPRIPVWVAGMWPYKKPFRRAARWDGVVPIGASEVLTPGHVKVVSEYVREHRTVDAPFDLVVAGQRLMGSPRFGEKAREFEHAGATWWLESFFTDEPVSLEQFREEVRNGPPGT
jgi:alkanesulfonate monooxygenase SsuD/methylene tetrahydromethanopterin reductase-like flavin-dependent oxidoreductase (luciferase family)